MEGFYMFKKVFTLAEVLITLGIVGVIAAITLPTLTQSTTTAQIGPKLMKAVSAFEQANKALLNEYDVDKLSDTNLLSDASSYVDALSNYLKFSYDGTNLVSKDGMGYVVSITEGSTYDAQIPAHKESIGMLTIDINGPNVNPNVSGTDLFYFSWWNDGSLRPKGATNWDGADTSKKDGAAHWTTKCNNTSEDDLSYCAGHIFENNLKVLYR